MKKFVHIGVTLTHGCDLPGGEEAMRFLSKRFPFNASIEINKTLIKDEQPLYLSALTDFNHRLKALIQTHTADGAFPIVFGGDHSLAIGSIAAHEMDDLAIIWIDAHGDCNTDESSLSQRIHGMPLAIVQGYGHPNLISLMDTFVESKNVLCVGIRDLDPLEKELMEKWGNQIIYMDQINEYGLDWCLAKVRNFMKQHEHVHVSFDCDSMDPLLIPGVNTPVSKGFTPEQLHPLLNEIFKSDHCIALDIVEFNPVQDNGNTLELIDDIQKRLQKAKGK